MKLTSVLIWFVCAIADGFIAVRTLKAYADSKKVIDLIIGIGCVVLSCFFVLCSIACMIN